MGDRANVVVLQEGSNDTVCLYTHWGGHDLPQVLAAALARGRGRWGDDAYLARIIFNEMTRDDVDGDTGFGISANFLSDNSYPLLIVDTAFQQVRMASGDWIQERDQSVLPSGWKFQDFIDEFGTGEKRPAGW